MEPALLMQLLEELAAEVGIEVRRASADGGLLESGVCRIRDRVWVVIDPTDPLHHRIDVLAGALRDHGGAALDQRFLPPAVREHLLRD